MSGVGTELAKLIPSWLVQQRKECNCKTVQAKLDDLGIPWCENNKQYLVAHLLSQSERLIPLAKIVSPTIQKRIAVKLVEKAIENARKAT